MEPADTRELHTAIISSHLHALYTVVLDARYGPRDAEGERVREIDDATDILVTALTRVHQAVEAYAAADVYVLR